MEGTEKNRLEGADKMAKEIDAMVQAGTGAIPPVSEHEQPRNRRNGADRPRGGDSQRIVGQLIKESKESLSVDFNKLLGITFPEASATFVRAELPITDASASRMALCMEALRSRCSKRRRVSCRVPY